MMTQRLLSSARIGGAVRWKFAFALFGLTVLAICLNSGLQRVRDHKVVDAKAGELRGMFAQWKRSGSPRGAALEKYASDHDPLRFLSTQVSETSDGKPILGLFATTNLPGISDSTLLIDESGVIYLSRAGHGFRKFWP